MQNITEIDWCKVWESQVADFRKESEWKNPCQKWDHPQKAEAFWESASSSQLDRIEATLSGLELEAGFKVLDIGCGPGNLTLPIAEKVAHVTAVDASGSMIRLLKKKADERNLINISTLISNWEDVDEEDLKPPYDLVLASLCWDMLDVRGALQMMQRVARGKICCICHAGEPAWKTLKKEVYTKLHGREVLSFPKADVLFNILYQWGKFPEVEVYQYDYLESFVGREEAIAFYLDEFKLGPHQGESLWQILLTYRVTAGQPYSFNFPSTVMKLTWNAK